MSAAFALSPSGPPKSQLAIRRCPAFPGPRYGVCEICRVKFVLYGDHAHPMPRICTRLECGLEFCRREPMPTPLLCCCPQRPYAHDLSTHKLLRSESYHPQRRFSYPWSLCSSERLELSTEKE